MSLTTLEGFFLDDDDCVRSRVEAAIAAGKFQKNGKNTPVQVRLGWQSASVGNFPDVVKKDFAQLVAVDVLPLVHGLKDEFLQMWGSDPLGTIRLRIYPVGQSDNPLQIVRKIGTAGEAPVDRQILVMLINRNAHLESQTVLVHKQTGDIIAHLVASNSAKDKTIETLATARAVTTSAADAQGVGALLSLAALMFLWKPITRALELPENASPVIALKLAQKKLEASSREILSGMDKPDTPTPPTQAITDAKRAVEGQSADELLRQVNAAAAVNLTPEQAAELLPPVARLAEIINGSPAKRAELKQYLIEHAAELM